MPLRDHLAELRNRIIVSLVAFAALSIVAFIAFNQIIDVLLRPLCALGTENLGPQGCKLIFTEAMEPFMFRLKVTAMVGLVAAGPVWLYQVWAFFTPALKENERRYALPFIVSCLFFFAIGATLAYIMLPQGLRFLIALGGDQLVPFLRAESYLNFVGLVVLGFGLTFQLPLVLFFLGLVGAVSVQQLQRKRRVAVVAITVLAAVVTPSQDPYTMTIMAVPLYALYETTIIALRLVARRRRRREALGK